MSNKNIRLAMFAAIAIPVVTTVRPAAGQSYDVIDLGTLGGAESRAYAINDLGQVAGEAMTQAGESRAFLWLPEAAYGLPAGMSDLETLGGPDSAAFGLNNAGQVVGSAETGGPAVSRAFLWDPAIGEMQDLGTLPGPSVARAINDWGEIVGTARDFQAFDQAFFRWEEGTLVLFSDLVIGDFTSEGFGIGYTGNLNFAGTTFFPAHAFKFGGETGFLQLEDLGIESSAFAMNAVNQVAGSFKADEYEHAALWKITTPADLGTLGGTNSRAFGINEATQVVGYAETAGGDRHAFVWETDAMVDLNEQVPVDSGWLLIEARQINGDAQIVGSGTHDGQMRAFLLTPRCSGDANGDGVVDPLDSGYVLARLGCPVGEGDPDCDAADQNHDGLVDPLDVGFVLARFGECE